MVGPLLSVEGQRALGFHQKYLNLCSEDERRSYGFTVFILYFCLNKYSLGEHKRLLLKYIIKKNKKKQ